MRVHLTFSTVCTTTSHSVHSLKNPPKDRETLTNV